MNNATRVREIIEGRNAEAVRSYADGDADALASLFSEDAWQMPPHLPAVVGRKAIREFWRAALQWGDWDFTLSTQTVEVSDPVAVERGKYVLRFEAGVGAPPGMKSFEDRGNYLVHWRNEGGDWLVAADAPVSELPLPGAAQGAHAAC
jgi:uncharacterized protein (TIGR02246 family)